MEAHPQEEIPIFLFIVTGLSSGISNLKEAVQEYLEALI